MYDSNVVAETRRESFDRLWGERYFGDEHYRLPPLSQDMLYRLQVYFGLSARGYAVEEERPVLVLFYRLYRVPTTPGRLRKYRLG